jgi:hypothetical protein
MNWAKGGEGAGGTGGDTVVVDEVDEELDEGGCTSGHEKRAVIKRPLIFAVSSCP